MQITRWSPFMDPFNFDKEFEKFFKEMAPARTGQNSLQAPSMNMFQKGKDIKVEMSMPGIDLNNVTVEIDEQNVLTVKGSNKKKTEVEDKDYYRKEIREGSFYRSIQLPVNVDGDKAEAEYEDGMLMISVPMEAKKKSTAIKIKKKKKLQSGK